MVAEIAPNRWWIVIASASALVAGHAPISIFAADVFLKPVSQELEFGRGDISTTIAVSSIMIMIPERRGEIVTLGLRSILSGTMATCTSGALVGLIG